MKTKKIKCPHNWKDLSCIGFKELTVICNRCGKTLLKEKDKTKIIKAWAIITTTGKLGLSTRERFFIAKFKRLAEAYTGKGEKVVKIEIKILKQ